MSLPEHTYDRFFQRFGGFIEKDIVVGPDYSKMNSPTNKGGSQMKRSILILTSISYVCFSGSLIYGQVVLFRDNFDGPLAEEWLSTGQSGTRKIENGW